MKGTELSAAVRSAVCLLCRPSQPRTRLIDRSIRRTSCVRSPLTCFSSSAFRRSEVINDERPKADFTAAPAINLEGGQESSKDVRKEEETDAQFLRKLRVVPASPSYFSGKPQFVDSLLALQSLLRKYVTLPAVPPIQAPRVAWLKLSEMRILLNEPVQAARYHKIINVLKRLNCIHPDLMPQEVTEALQKYKRRVQPKADAGSPQVPDEYGRAVGLGRRKTASALAWLVEGEGEVLINGRTLSQFFERLHHRESAIWSLKATQRIDKYNVWALVRGGGVTGQAEALTLAIARALMVHEPLLKPALRRAGCVTRDARMVERKKPGKLKARKMPAWVKR